MPYPAYAGVNSPVGLISAAHQAYCGQVLRAEYRTLRFDLAEVRLGSDGGGGRLTQRCALRPSGRCRWQRFLAFARIEPYSKLLILPRTERYETLCLTGIRYATGVMVVGEGLLSAARFALRVVACGNAFSLSLESNLIRSFSSFPVRRDMRHYA